ncbi:MAG: hypothetical protein BYD32DRAFT_458245 [Podila humilis]|nr:MAG: hypothetical protein BYD32DRAFT_458245 [Podila humilis]
MLLAAASSPGAALGVLGLVGSTILRMMAYGSSITYDVVVGGAPEAIACTAAPIVIHKMSLEGISKNVHHQHQVCNVANKQQIRQTPTLPKALKINLTLTTLNLDANWIVENGGQALSEALKTNSNLTTLNLAGSWIRSNVAVSLSEALKTNSTLTTLGLQNNLIGDNGVLTLSEALKFNSTLTTLDSGAQALAKALNLNSNLVSLNLAGNSSNPLELRR